MGIKDQMAALLSDSDYLLYTCECVDRGYTMYLGLYADGTVISATVSSLPANHHKIVKWFSRQHSDMPQGVCRIKDDRISFTTVSSEGSVEYYGGIQKDKLILTSHSNINGHKASKTYDYVGTRKQLIKNNAD